MFRSGAFIDPDSFGLFGLCVYDHCELGALDMEFDMLELRNAHEDRDLPCQWFAGGGQVL